MTRDECFFKIIDARNEAGHQHGYTIMYDCGELGICEVYWHRGWERRWHDVPLQKPPFDLTPVAADGCTCAPKEVVIMGATVLYHNINCPAATTAEHS